MRTKAQTQIVAGDVWQQEAYGSAWHECQEIGRAVTQAQGALGLTDLGLAGKTGVSVKMIKFIKRGYIRKRPSPAVRRTIEKLLMYFEGR